MSDTQTFEDNLTFSKLFSSPQFLLTTLIPIGLFIWLFVIGWTNLWLLAFPWILFGESMWFNFLAAIKATLIAPQVNLINQPVGKEQSYGVFFCVSTIGLQLILLLLGEDSIAHYQLMNIYGYYYIIPLITIFNFTGFWIPFTIWQDAKIAASNSDKTCNFENKLDVVHVRKMILIFGGLFLGIELLFLLDQFLWIIIQTGIWSFGLSTPGSIINASPLIPTTGIIIICLIVQPIGMILCLYWVNHKITNFSLTSALATVNSWTESPEYKRKVIRSLEILKD